ncbi:hypothetical protein AVEN_223745-1 [Araneus ventricosus]|uniref:Uncharacterized protein n=1 Tax=Araneus ventricosus TaxID=182803 RepID=A0A4Y2RE71_ARAVE|nr:hypothetical protein AVEN_223745-1 [Araneus ventricosus]
MVTKVNPLNFTVVINHLVYLKAFGSTAYAGVPKQLGKKFDMRAKRDNGIMPKKPRISHLLPNNERKIVETINVPFDEDNMLGTK